MEKQDEIGGDNAKTVATHTPGPWVARHLPTDGAFTVETDRDNSSQRWWIADMGNSAHIHPAEREANARLIAAAPLMYERLVKEIGQEETDKLLGY